MIILSHGYMKPQNGIDAGSVWFPAFEKNTQTMNDHTHNGVDANLIAVTNQSILSANWLAATVGGGLYQQTMILPAGFLYDAIDMFFRLSTGEIWYPTIVRVSSTSYQIFCNDTTLTAIAFYR